MLYFQQYLPLFCIPVEFFCSNFMILTVAELLKEGHQNLFWQCVLLGKYRKLLDVSAWWGVCEVEKMPAIYLNKD